MIRLLWMVLYNLVGSSLFMLVNTISIKSVSAQAVVILLLPAPTEARIVAFLTLS